MNNDILDAPQFEKNRRRRDLLSVWVKLFIWIFLILGVFALMNLMLSLLEGSGSAFSIYGLNSTGSVSFLGIFIIGIFLLKGIVSFGLWTEKDWGVNLAIVDAIIGIVICVVTIRLDLLILIPYLIAMLDTRSRWDDLKMK